MIGRWFKKEDKEAAIDLAKEHRGLRVWKITHKLYTRGLTGADVRSMFPFEDKLKEKRYYVGEMLPKFVLEDIHAELRGSVEQIDLIGCW
jgi:hypothetical protein